MSHAKLCEKDAALISTSMIAVADSEALLKRVSKQLAAATLDHHPHV
jgi:hypothetical protein